MMRRRTLEKSDVVEVYNQALPVDIFSILDSSVTNQEVIDAGYVKGITRIKLDGTQFLVQSEDVLPAALDEFVVVKNKTLEEILPTLKNTDWSDMTVGI